jgi:CRP-like cAMP-binding protein
MNVNALLDALRAVRFAPGDLIASEGAQGDELIFVVCGSVSAHSFSGLSTTFESGSVLGLIPSLMDRPHPGTLTAETAITGYVLSRADCERLRACSPEFDARLRELTAQSLEQLERLISERDERSIAWLREASNALSVGAQLPDPIELRAVREEYSGVPLAIWLGILIDGIPESFVIGAGLVTLLLSTEAASSLQFEA